MINSHQQSRSKTLGDSMRLHQVIQAVMKELTGQTLGQISLSQKAVTH